MLFGEGPQIKNIAADLNKLFRQGSLLNQIGQTVEGDSTADQGTSDLLAARDPVIQEISVGMSGEQSARYTVSGTPPLSLPNSLGKPLKAWSVEVSPYQEGTGDPAPDNVRPIHGTDKVTITTAGKNLFDKTADNTNNGYVADKYLTAGGSESSPSAGRIWFISEYIPVLPNSVYSLSGMSSTASSLPSVCLYDTNKAYITGVAYGNATSRTFTTPNNCAFVRISVGPVAEQKDSIQFELSATVTEYEPFVGSSTVIPLPSTVYTATIGSDGGESRSGYRVFDGSSDEVIRGYSGNRFTIDVADYTSPAATVIDSITASYLKTVSKGTQGITPWLISGSDNGLHQIMVNFGLSTVDEMRAYLAEHPLELVYPLTTPTEFTVTASEIPTPTGAATTWATAEDGTVESMEVTYIGKA